MTLQGVFAEHRGRLASKWPHYIPIYERWFSPWIQQPVTVLELGVDCGGSLEIWKRYFGPQARIVGIDSNPNCRAVEQEQISVRIGDQADEKFLASVLGEFGTPDIVIDDASHMAVATVASFSYLYPRVSPAGLYVVEDLHCSYWARFGGGLRQPGTFIELAKGLVDEINAEWTEGQIAVGERGKSIEGIHFYNSLCVIERGAQGPKAPQHWGANS